MIANFSEKIGVSLKANAMIQFLHNLAKCQAQKASNFFLTKSIFEIIT
jgi:hypothetical protein